MPQDPNFLNKDKEEPANEGGNGSTPPKNPTTMEGQGVTEYTEKEIEKGEGLLGYSKITDTTSAQDYYKQKVEAQYGEDILSKHENEAISASTKSANYVAQNAAKANENYVRNEYQTSQSLDKTGWTGGYALDSQRQLDYLKSSIQADIFSQQELQKLGYTSALAQAQQAAELEQDQLAFERYQAAQQEAIAKANVTGMYIEPHISDMLTQFQAAQNILDKKGSDEAANARAQKIVDYVQKNIRDLTAGKGYKLGENEQGQVVSIEGIKTLAAISAEAEKKYQEAAAEFNQAQKEQLDIQTAEAIENTYDPTQGNFIPYFTADGKIAGYGKQLPKGNPNDPESDAGRFKQYIQDNPAEFNKFANNSLSHIAASFKAALEKNPDLEFGDFMSQQYNGQSLGDFLDMYAGKDKNGKPLQEEYTFNGVTIKYVHPEGEKPGWVISDGNGTGFNDTTDEPVGTQGTINPDQDLGKTKSELNEIFNKYSGANLINNLPETITWENYKTSGLTKDQQNAYLTAIKEASSTTTNDSEITTGDSLTINTPPEWDFANNTTTFTLRPIGNNNRVENNTMENAVGKDRLANFKQNGQLCISPDGELVIYSTTKGYFIDVSRNTWAKSGGEIVYDKLVSKLADGYFDARKKS